MKTVLSSMFVLATIAAGHVLASPVRLDVVIQLDQTGNRCRISGRFVGEIAADQKNLSFTDNYADANRLARRVLNPTVTDKSGGFIELKKFSEGEFVANRAFAGFNYSFDLRTPDPLIAAPHISWFASPAPTSKEKALALLKLSDLLPDIRAEVYIVKIELPEKWQIATSEKAVGGFEYEIRNLDDAVFLAGTHVRTQSRRFRNSSIDISLADRWQFEDDVVADMTLEILDEYQRLFGIIPSERIQINLLKFPAEMENDRWRAETQGGTITIVSADSTYPNLAPQRLHEQLRHELFHLWIPESVALEGDYAWFYEGFAQYQSLKSGVWVGRLRFEDFLRSMSDAINIASFDRSKRALTDLSLARWQTGPGVVSARGMTVAFLCDVILLESTGRKKNIGDVLQNVFQKHGANAKPQSANPAIERELLSFDVLKSVVDRQINANEPIEWPLQLDAFGIEVSSRGGRVSLSVPAKPRRSQKALLNKLGYNRWKIAPRSD